MLYSGCGYHTMQTDIVEWLDFRMACEAGSLKDGAGHD